MITTNLIETLGNEYVNDRLIRQSQRPFADGSMVDPCTLFSISRSPGARNLFVLKDWWNDNGNGNVGTVAGNVAYCEEVYRGSRYDATLSRLFRTEWSGRLFRTGDYAVVNCVWGLKISDSPVGPVAKAVLDRSYSLLLLPLIEAARPEIVRLCGRWAGKYYELLKPTFGERVIWHCHPGQRRGGWGDGAVYV